MFSPTLEILNIVTWSVKLKCEKIKKDLGRHIQEFFCLSCLPGEFRSKTSLPMASLHLLRRLGGV